MGASPVPMQALSLDPPRRCVASWLGVLKVGKPPQDQPESPT